MRSLVIGSDSFLGHYLVRHLQEDLHDEVIAADSDAASAWRVSVLEKDSIQTLLESTKPERVFCLAGIHSIGYAWEHPNEIVDYHIIGTLNVLDSIKAVCKDVPVLLIGSGEEYGRVSFDELPITEEHTVAPENIYSVSKVTQNMIAQLYCEAFGMNVVIARSFNDVGPEQEARFVLSSICCQIAKIELGLQPPIVSVGNLNVERDFTDVRDTVRALCMLSSSGRSGEIYNVASGSRTSIRKIIELLQQLTQKPFEIKADTEKIRLNDIPALHADISKIARETGWHPQIPIEKTLSDMVKHWHGQLSR